MNFFTPARKVEAAYHNWHSGYLLAAAHIIDITGCAPHPGTFEHVGSTAVPGCGGKGVMDMLYLYPAGALNDSVTYLLDLGLVRQGDEFAHRWPDSRPMLLGTVMHDSQEYVVYVHVVASESDEVRRFRQFRSLLCESPAHVERYNETKKGIVAMGIINTDQYVVMKRPIMHEILGPAHALSKTIQQGTVGDATGAPNR